MIVSYGVAPFGAGHFSGRCHPLLYLSGQAVRFALATAMVPLMRAKSRGTQSLVQRYALNFRILVVPTAYDRIETIGLGIASPPASR